MRRVNPGRTGQDPPLTQDRQLSLLSNPPHRRRSTRSVFSYKRPSLSISDTPPPLFPRDSITAETTRRAESVLGWILLSDMAYCDLSDSTALLFLLDCVSPSILPDIGGETRIYITFASASCILLISEESQPPSVRLLCAALPSLPVRMAVHYAAMNTGRWMQFTGWTTGLYGGWGLTLVLHLSLAIYHYWRT
jgi:hypothetical protein